MSRMISVINNFKSGLGPLLMDCSAVHLVHLALDFLYSSPNTNLIIILDIFPIGSRHRRPGVVLRDVFLHELPLNKTWERMKNTRILELLER